jgi:branched-chain amino acid transport system substrate-binding protein
MTTPKTTRFSISRRTFAAGASAAVLSTTLPLRRARAAGKLKIGVILPLSGIQGQIGQDCKRGADVALSVLKAHGYPDFELMYGDTETNVQTARAVAEKLVGEGADALVGSFDSGQTTAIAQVAEQKGRPLVISIAAADAITEQGYKYVFRNFPTGRMIVTDAFALQKELYDYTKKAPKTAVLLHVNDTYGTGVAGAINKMFPDQGMPFKLVEQIAYDPAAKDLSVEVTKAKATKADLAWVVSRLNDAILMTREMIKQRWEPMGVISTGPGWYDDQYLKVIGKYSSDILSTVPWYDPTKPMAKALRAALKKAFPDISMNTNHVYTFEAIQIAVDAFKRAGSADPQAMADALRKTDIKDNVTICPSAKFNEKGQNVGLRMAMVQNKGGSHVVVAPRNAADAQPVWPERPWAKRA